MLPRQEIDEWTLQPSFVDGLQTSICSSIAVNDVAFTESQSPNSANECAIHVGSIPSANGFENSSRMQRRYIRGMLSKDHIDEAGDIAEPRALANTSCIDRPS